MTRTVATWNVNSLRVRLPHLTEWLTANPVDAIALQETKLPDADFPAADLQALGWNCTFSGQRTYNGVAIGEHRVVRYWPRIESDFSLRERWQSTAAGAIALFFAAGLMLAYAPQAAAQTSEQLAREAAAHLR